MCSGLQFGEIQKFRMNVSPLPPSRFKCNPGNKLGEAIGNEASRFPCTTRRYNPEQLFLATALESIISNNSSLSECSKAEILFVNFSVLRKHNYYFPWKYLFSLYSNLLVLPGKAKSWTHLTLLISPISWFFHFQEISQKPFSSLC